MAIPADGDVVGNLKVNVCQKVRIGECKSKNVLNRNAVPLPAILAVRGRRQKTSRGACKKDRLKSHDCAILVRRPPHLHFTARSPSPRLASWSSRYCCGRPGRIAGCPRSSG